MSDAAYASAYFRILVERERKRLQISLSWSVWWVWHRKLLLWRILVSFYSFLFFEIFVGEPDAGNRSIYRQTMHYYILKKTISSLQTKQNKTTKKRKISPTSMKEQCHNLEDSNLCKTRIPWGFISCTHRGLKLWVKLNSQRLKFSSRCREIRTRPRQLRWRFAPRT